MNDGMLGRGFLIALTAALAAGLLPSTVLAESFPSHSIRIVVGGGPGTPPDIITRVVANAVSEAEGWQFVIENKPGGGQTLAGLEVVRSLPDGYSLFAAAMPISAAPALLANMPFNLISEFAPVIRLSASYNVLVVNPSVPANSVADLVALLKKQPDKLTFSPVGSARRPTSLVSCSSCRMTCTRPTFPIRRIFPTRSATCSTAPTSTCSSPPCRWSI